MTLHHLVRLLGAAGTLALFGWLVWHLYRSVPARIASLAAWLRGLAAEGRAVEAELELTPVEHVGAQDDAATTRWIDRMWLDDDTDDAVPVDMAAVMAEQDAEEGREFVARVERHLSLSTAVTFGFVYLPDIRRPRPVRSGAPR